MERKYSGAVCELLCCDRTFPPRMTRSQQDLKLTETNKLTCMHSELAKGFAVLTLHRPQSSLQLKWWRSIQVSVHYPFYVWLCEVLRKVY